MAHCVPDSHFLATTNDKVSTRDISSDASYLLTPSCQVTVPVAGHGGLFDFPPTHNVVLLCDHKTTMTDIKRHCHRMYRQGCTKYFRAIRGCPHPDCTLKRLCGESAIWAKTHTRRV